MQIFVSSKSGNLVTKVPNSECKIYTTKAVSVTRIDKEKTLLVPESSLIPLEQFLEGGSTVANSLLRKVKELNPSFPVEQYLE